MHCSAPARWLLPVLLATAACASPAGGASPGPGGAAAGAEGGRGGGVFGEVEDAPGAPPPLAAGDAELVPYLRHEVAYVVNVSGGRDVFHHAGAFWTLHEGWWFRAAAPGARWRPVEMKRVPRELFRVCGYRPATLGGRDDGRERATPPRPDQ